MRRMRVLFAVLGCLLSMGAKGGENGDGLPDLLFHESGGSGGFGRLSFDATTNRYLLLDGRVHAYVVDAGSIRLMRPDDRSRTMGNPRQVVALGGRLFGGNAYSRILEFDTVTGVVLNTYPLGDFSYSGGVQPGLYASERAMLVLDGQRVLALGPELQRLGEQQLSTHAGREPDPASFIQAGEQLHALTVDNPNVRADCPGGCNLAAIIRHTTVDFSQAADIRVSSREETLKKPLDFSHRAVDVAGGGWLVARRDLKNEALALEWRSFGQLAEANSQLWLDAGTRIEAATQSAPFWLVLSTKDGEHQLAHVNVNGPAITIRKFPLGWLAGSVSNFGIVADRDARIYVTANHKLAVYEPKGSELRLRLQQDFGSEVSGASQLQLLGIVPVKLAPARLKVDRVRLEDLLAKRYWDDADQRAIEAEIDKITAEDTWTIALFTDLARSRTHSYLGGVLHAARALEKFGPAAAAAVPALVAATMEGSSIRSDILAKVIPAVRKIDPRGQIVRQMLPDCIRKTYVCEHVGRAILRGISN